LDIEEKVQREENDALSWTLERISEPGNRNEDCMIILAQASF
jgi:hypothetical protein